MVKGQRNGFKTAKKPGPINTSNIKKKKLWIISAPKNFDLKLLKDINIDFEKKSKLYCHYTVEAKIKLGEKEYILSESSVYDPNQLNLLLPTKSGDIKIVEKELKLLQIKTFVPDS